VRYSDGLGPIARIRGFDGSQCGSQGPKWPEEDVKEI